MNLNRFLIIGWFGLVGVVRLPGASYEVIIPSDNQNRAAQVLHLKVPTDFPRSNQLLSADGMALPLQWEPDGSASVLIPFQPAGQTLSYRPGSMSGSLNPPQVSVKQGTDELSVRSGSSPVLAFRTNAQKVPRPDIAPIARRAGYLHPVYSPSGKVVTDDYPANHMWHHGIWTPWTKSTFRGHEVDFWNLEKKWGAEDFLKLERTWDGPVQGGFVAQLAMSDFTVKPEVRVLDETWVVRVYQTGGLKRPVWLFDLEVTQRCATDDPLQIEQYHYGGFGLRGAAEWDGPGDAARFLTSEGVTDRIKGNGLAARWVYMGGLIGGEKSGIAVLTSPENFRFPQPVRLHPYFPYFSLVPQQSGAFAIKPGQPYVAQYRFMVTDGEASAGEIEACWQGYAHPAIPQIVSVPNASR